MGQKLSNFQLNYWTCNLKMICYHFVKIIFCSFLCKMTDDCEKGNYVGSDFTLHFRVQFQYRIHLFHIRSTFINVDSMWLHLSGHKSFLDTFLVEKEKYLDNNIIYQPRVIPFLYQKYIGECIFQTPLWVRLKNENNKIADNMLSTTKIELWKITRQWVFGVLFLHPWFDLV